MGGRRRACRRKRPAFVLGRAGRGLGACRVPRYSARLTLLPEDYPSGYRAASTIPICSTGRRATTLEAFVHDSHRPRMPKPHLRKPSSCGELRRDRRQARMEPTQHAPNVRLDVEKVFEGHCGLIDGHAAAVECAATLCPATARSSVVSGTYTISATHSGGQSNPQGPEDPDAFACLSGWRARSPCEFASAMGRSWQTRMSREANSSRSRPDSAMARDTSVSWMMSLFDPSVSMA